MFHDSSGRWKGGTVVGVRGAGKTVIGFGPSTCYWPGRAEFQEVVNKCFSSMQDAKPLFYWIDREPYYEGRTALVGRYEQGKRYRLPDPDNAPQDNGLTEEATKIVEEFLND